MIIICIDCKDPDKPIENEDLCLCASCNKARRKAEKEAAKPKKFHEIRKVSEKKAKALREKHKAYSKMDLVTPPFCSGCGRSGVPLSHSHIIPVGQYPQFEAVVENLVYDCIAPNPEMNGGHSCHDIWEHGDWQAVKQLSNLQERLNVIIKLCPAYFNLMMIKK
jgi:hypothetical protein